MPGTAPVDQDSLLHCGHTGFGVPRWLVATHTVCYMPPIDRGSEPLDTLDTIGSAETPVTLPADNLEKLNER